MTVVDKHTCSSPVVIKLGAICVAVYVVVDRFNFFVIFLCWGIHNKVLILFAHCNGPYAKKGKVRTAR